MAMSAASAASIVVATIASATVASTSASSTGEHVYHAFDFVIAGRTAFYHFTDKGEVFASQTVVQVNDDFCLLYFYDQTLEMVSVFVDQGDIGSRVDVF